ncbi:MAG: electron transfer flavoprotein beta subunit/FixA family protein [Actinomycetota bacterium]|nr:electron transfer flavoprotein beta subunit/FixA family protein [Actinomycetota bacterium]
MKRTPAVGAQVGIAADGRHLDTRLLGFTIGPHEECAVEEAVRIAERHRDRGDPARVTVLTVGPAQAADQLRTAIAAGADAGVLVEAQAGDDAELDPQETAAALVHGIVEAGIRFDLLLFGTESAVAGHGQVGIRVARALGLTIVVGVTGVDEEGDGLVLRRRAGDGIEVYRVPTPAAVAVKEGLNLPRYPTMPGRIRARRATLTTVTAPPARQAGLRTVRLRPPVDERPETVRLGSGADAAPAVVDVLERIGVV